MKQLEILEDLLNKKKTSLFKDVDEKRVIHSKSDNIESMTYDNANEIFNELSESLLSRYQTCIITSVRGSDFIFDSFQLLH